MRLERRDINRHAGPGAVAAFRLSEDGGVYAEPAELTVQGVAHLDDRMARRREVAEDAGERGKVDKLLRREVGRAEV